MYNEPVSFKEATDQMAARLDTPTAMRYKEITAAWDAQFRRRAFFYVGIVRLQVQPFKCFLTHNSIPSLSFHELILFPMI